MKRAKLPLLSITLASMALMLLLAGCSKSTPKAPTLPQFNRGNTYGFGVLSMKTVKSVTYIDQDTTYVITPSEPNNVFLATELQVSNERAVKSLLDVKTTSVEMIDKNAKDYQAINPFGDNRKQISTAPTDSEPLSPFIWGQFELQQGYGVTGWVLFEVPKDTKAATVRGDEVDTISIDVG